MKRHFLLFAVCAYTIGLMAQGMSAGYYDAIEGKEDSVLKSTLSQIIYSPGRYEAGERYKYGTRAVNEKHTHNYTWDGFVQTDMREDGTVWDMYSNRIHYMLLDTLGGVSIPDLEIEHCFPKSWWGGADNDAYKDLHHLNPANSRANNKKSANPPGYAVTNIDECSDIFRMGKNSAYGTFLVFEPCDEYKGDFARAYFYISTAYEQLQWQSNYMDNTSYLEFKPWLQQVLVEWHRLDPVSEKEITRNNRVYAIQHNRNPFIDYPDLVEYIWGNKVHTPVDMSQLVYTGSEAYELPIETLVSRALPATDVRSTGFTAHWKDAGNIGYELDVFTSSKTGHNDTILNMSVFNKASIQANSYFSTSGSFGTTGTGKGTTTFGTNSNPLVVTISGLTIPANSRIVVRAMAPLKINNTAGAQMKISANGIQIALQTLTHDEEYYSFPLPAGTPSIVIEQGNGKLFNVEQLFIISGDEVITHNSLNGFPIVVNGTNYTVMHAMEIDVPVYYTVTPSGLRTSTPITVIYDGTDAPTAISFPDSNQPPARKELRDGQMVIIRNNTIFSTLGQVIR